MEDGGEGWKSRMFARDGLCASRSFFSQGQKFFRRFSTKMTLLRSLATQQHGSTIGTKVRESAVHVSIAISQHGSTGGAKVRERGRRFVSMISSSYSLPALTKYEKSILGDIFQYQARTIVKNDKNL
jgi:hypothetical protein